MTIGRRGFRHLFGSIAVCAMLGASIIVVSGSAASAQGGASFEASLDGDYVAGCDFAANSSVLVVVKDTPGGSTLSSGPAATDGGGCFNRDAGVDLVPGMYVSVTDGVTPKDLTLVTLSIDSVDTVNRTVSGMAPPTTTFNVDTDVCPGGCGTFVSAYPVTSNGAGQWVADFAAHGVTAFVPGNDIGANISDGDGDNTIYDVSVPNPRFEASVYQGSGVDGCEFAPNSSVSVTVKSGPAGTTLASGSASTDGDGCFGFDSGITQLPGMFISVGDGVVTKTLLLVNLRITEVNPETATAYGVAPPNTTFNVDVDTCVGNCGDFVSAYPVVSNSKGAWTANFGTLGVDFGPITGNDLGANISDNDGDNTIFDVGVPPTVGDLSAEVNALVPQAQRQPLLQVLQTAHQLLLQNKVSSAIGQLRSFESQVRSLVRSKKLSAASGDQLIGLAEQLIGGLQGCC